MAGLSLRRGPDGAQPLPGGRDARCELQRSRLSMVDVGAQRERFRRRTRTAPAAMLRVE